MKTDHYKMLHNIGELTHLFSESRNLTEFLNGTIDIIRHHLTLTACGIYIYNNRSNLLTLEACWGFDCPALKSVTFTPGKGIIGKTLTNNAPVSFRNGRDNPDLSFILPYTQSPDGSFLILPIQQGNNPIGVMILQRQTGLPFKKHDVSSLVIMTSQLSTVINHVQMLLVLETHPSRKISSKILNTDNKVFQGRSASNGFAYGPCKFFKKDRILSFFYEKKYTQKYTLEDFHNAITATEKQLENLQKKVERKLADIASLIFTSHLLILKDEAFIKEIESLIRGGSNAPDAVITVGKKYLNMFAISENLILQEKQQDLEDLLTRVLHNLVYKQGPFDSFRESIVIARELFPSDILRMSAKEVKGIILLNGGVTSHVAILARSLQMPLVILDNPVLLTIPNDTPVIVDADTGDIYINPSQDIIKEFEKHLSFDQEWEINKDILNKATLTLDNVQIKLYSNINLVSDALIAAKFNTDGIGLYRTEFPFLMRSNFPTEEEQYVIYCKVADKIKDKPITFRTLDIGGDKLLSYYDYKEKNPFLGFRSTRFTMQHKDIFKHQIRAILRAGQNKDLRIMFPMISSIEEFLEAKDILQACILELSKAKIPHNAAPLLGIMVEVPSILDIIDDMAKEVDFFSIGTNDLIQFLIAVDRSNEKVANLYNPLHPSVLRCLDRIVSAAMKNGIDVSICGDMAHEVKYLPFLIGIGLRSLSINPVYFPKMKKAVLKTDGRKAKTIADRMLKESRFKNIESALNAYDS